MDLSVNIKTPNHRTQINFAFGQLTFVTFVDVLQWFIFNPRLLSAWVHPRHIVDGLKGNNTMAALSGQLLRLYNNVPNKMDLNLLESSRSKRTLCTISYVFIKSASKLKLLTIIHNLDP